MKDTPWESRAEGQGAVAASPGWPSRAQFIDVLHREHAVVEDQVRDE